MNFEEIGDKRSLPARVVEAVTASILSGNRREGDALPTELELAAQFGVSRTVIRDAVQMLVAKGLVEVRRGKGTFVAASRGAAFAEAMVLALGRRGATAWDVEEFTLLFLPELVALAAGRASEEDRGATRSAAEAYLRAFGEELGTKGGPESEARLKGAFAAFMRCILGATRNEVAMLVGETLISLREFRKVVDTGLATAELEQLAEAEARAIRGILEAFCSGDPEDARAKARRLLPVRPELKERLEATPVGMAPLVSLSMLGLSRT